jgi:hypothetical protein
MSRDSTVNRVESEEMDLRQSCFSFLQPISSFYEAQNVCYKYTSEIPCHATSHSNDLHKQAVLQSICLIFATIPIAFHFRFGHTPRML